MAASMTVAWGIYGMAIFVTVIAGISPKQACAVAAIDAAALPTEVT
jgi:hypothetical protein